MSGSKLRFESRSGWIRFCCVRPFAQKSSRLASPVVHGPWSSLVYLVCDIVSRKMNTLLEVFEYFIRDILGYLPFEGDLAQANK